ncbi:MAG: cell wall hydrolase [Gammaproteobacteria bacterium]|nr:cell wall hydrolase [Gammaproteobacteria bacterium]
MRGNDRHGSHAPRRRAGAPAAALIILTACLPTPAAAFVHPVALGQEKVADGEPVDVTAELHCLALNIYHEARGESLEGKLAVGRVTINRVRSPRYPDSVCRVVWQRGQFSWTRDGRPDRPYNLAAWEEALRIARIAAELDEDAAVGRATHYHAVYVRPSWARVYRRVRRIGRHVFYEPRESS